MTDDEADYVRLRAPDLAVQRVAGSVADPNPTSDIKALVEPSARHTCGRCVKIVHTHTTKAGVLGRLAAWSAGRAGHGAHLPRPPPQRATSRRGSRRRS